MSSPCISFTRNICQYNDRIPVIMNEIVHYIVWICLLSPWPRCSYVFDVFWASHNGFIPQWYIFNRFKESGNICLYDIVIYFYIKFEIKKRQLTLNISFNSCTIGQRWPQPTALVNTKYGLQLRVMQVQLNFIDY